MIENKKNVIGVLITLLIGLIVSFWFFNSIEVEKGHMEKLDADVQKGQLDGLKPKKSVDKSISVQKRDTKNEDDDLEEPEVESPDEKNESGKKEQVVKKEEEKKGLAPSQKKNKAIKTASISGDYMSTVELNVRESPDLTSNAIGVLTPYEKVTVSERSEVDGITWYKVSKGNLVGWSSSNYLVKYEEKNVQTSKKVAHGSSDKSEAKSNNGQKNINSGKSNSSVSKPSSHNSGGSQKNSNNSGSKYSAPSGHSLNSFEKKVVDLINQERKNHGLKPLSIDNRLSYVARKKSQDISENNYRSHNSPTFGTPHEMIRNHGISYRYAGENLAGWHTTPEEVVSAWMRSSGHKNNVLDSRWTHTGVGYVQNEFVWTQMFIQK